MTESAKTLQGKFENHYFEIVCKTKFQASMDETLAESSEDVPLEIILKTIPNFVLGLTEIGLYTKHVARFTIRLLNPTVPGTNMARLIEDTVAGFRAWLQEQGFTFDEYPFSKQNLAIPTRTQQLSGVLRSLAGQFNFNVRSALWTNHNNKVFKMYLRYDLVVYGYRADGINKAGSSLDLPHAGKNTVKGVLEYAGTDVLFFLDTDARADLAHLANSEVVKNHIVETFVSVWPIDTSRMKWVFFDGPDAIGMNLVDAYAAHLEVWKTLDKLDAQ